MDSRLLRSITLQFHCFLLFRYLKMSFFFSALNLGLFIPRIILELVFIEFRPEEMATAT